MAWIKAYKGFNKNLQCQPDDDKPPFQYEVGKEYEEYVLQNGKPQEVN